MIYDNDLTLYVLRMEFNTYKKYEYFLNYFVDDVPALGIYQTNMVYLVNKIVFT